MIIVGFDGNFSGLALPTGKAIRLSAYARQCLRRLIVLGKQTFAEPMNLVYQDKLTLLPNAPVFALQAIRAGLEGVLFLSRNPRKTPIFRKTRRRRKIRPSDKYKKYCTIAWANA